MMTSLSRLEPDVMASRLAAYAQLLEGLPDEVATLVDVVFEHLEDGPEVEEREPWAHVADHAQHLVPAVMADPRVGPVVDALMAEYHRLTAGSATYFSPAKIGVMGGIVVVVAVAEAIHACVEGPHPEPGMSLETHC